MVESTTIWLIQPNIFLSVVVCLMDSYFCCFFSFFLEIHFQRDLKAFALRTITADCRTSSSSVISGPRVSSSVFYSFPFFLLFRSTDLVFLKLWILQDTAFHVMKIRNSFEFGGLRRFWYRTLRWQKYIHWSKSSEHLVPVVIWVLACIMRTNKCSLCASTRPNHVMPTQSLLRKLYHTKPTIIK